MPLVALDYRFRTRLPAPADAAYRWATDYAPDDWHRMGYDGTRRIRRLAPGTLVLTDRVRVDGHFVTKVRLVRLRPRERAWTNTHLAGPNRLSQFLYHILPQGRRASVLEFVGLQVETSVRPLSRSALTARARTVAREDAAIWRRLARAMREELGPVSPGRRARRRAGARPEGSGPRSR
jgi:hypothetical protein